MCVNVKYGIWNVNEPDASAVNNLVRTGYGPLAAMILAARVFLGAVFSGQMSTILYSGAGGACAIGITILSRRFLTMKQIWVAGVLGSIAHCVGQMAVAIGVTLTPGLAAYLPVMIGIGIFTGAFTGFCAQFLTERLKL